jgi:uncharacterized membrane protein
MQFYYAVGGKQQGPVGSEALAALAREGKLKPDDLVWNSSFGNEWRKASTIPGLCDPLAPAPGADAAGGAEWSSEARFRGAMHNRDLMAAARQALAGNWGLAVGVTLVYLLCFVAMAAIPVLGNLVNLVISGPLILGFMTFFLVVARGGGATLGLLFGGFGRFGAAFCAYWLMALLVLAWALPGLVVVSVMLFFGVKSAVSGGHVSPAMALMLAPAYLAALIPALIAQYRYAMAYYVIQDQPGIGALEAIRRSKQLMDGNKWKLFCLQWRFFGWALLCVLTLGIGCLWLVPYMMTSQACFYEDLVNDR